MPRLACLLYIPAVPYPAEPYPDPPCHPCLPCLFTPAILAVDVNDAWIAGASHDPFGREP